MDAVGTPADPIYFHRTAAETSGTWSGIRFYTNSAGTNATVVIQPGVVVKTAGVRDDGSITVFGTLNCGEPGSAPVILTSMKDDTASGGTDQSTNAPTPGDWSGTRFYGPGGGTIQNTEVRYAGHIPSGWQGWHSAAAIYNPVGQLTLDHVSISSFQACAVRLSGGNTVMIACSFKQGPTALWIERGGEMSSVNNSQFIDISDYGVNNSNAAHDFDARNKDS